MLYKSIIPSNRRLFAVVALLITNLSILSSYAVAADAQNIYCNNGHEGEKKHIYVEYLNAKTKVCHTMYNAGGSQDRQIAWAQSNPSLCTEVANNLASRLIKAGWDCDGTVNITRKTQPKMTKKPVRAASVKRIKPALPIQDATPEQAAQPAQPADENKKDLEILQTIEK
jgi:hypothetical protein